MIIKEQDHELYKRLRQVIEYTPPKDITVSWIQRKIRIGYPRAANFFDQLKEDGIVSIIKKENKQIVKKERKHKYQLQIDKLYTILHNREAEIRDYIVQYINKQKRYNVSEETQVYSLLLMLDENERTEIYEVIDEINKGEYVDEICKLLFNRIGLKRRQITYGIIKTVRELLIDKCGIFYYSVPGNSYKFVITDMDFDKINNRNMKDLLSRKTRGRKIYKKAIELHPQLKEGENNWKLLK